MADHRLIVEINQKWEGGASADPNDKGLRYGHSGVLGKDGGDKRHPNNYIHTNKGVLWGTYVSYCKQKGKTPSAKEFIDMNQSLWLDIFKTLFWDKINGDNIKSQAIAEILVEAIWVGGADGMIKTLQRFLNENGASPILSVDGGVGKATYTALNKYANTKAKEMKIVELLTNQRLNWYKGLSDFYRYGKGWTDRVNEVYARAVELVKKGAASNIGKAIFGALVFGGLAFYFSDNIAKLYKRTLKVLK